MKTLPTCLCMLGLTAAANAGGLVLMDQIGPNDGSNIDTTNMFANQIFEAAYSIYSIVALDDFDNTAGSSASSVSLVVGGWNGYVGIDGVSALSANFYNSPEEAGASLVGYSNADVAGTPTGDPDWAGPAGTTLVTVNAALAINAGMAYVGLIPTNEFATNGQTGAGLGFTGDGAAWQCNPGLGFGFGPVQEALGNIAIRVTGGTGNECDLPLRPAPCNADVDHNNVVNVEDLLGVIGTFGDVGDGVTRPLGDCAPLPNGDCIVNVEDVLSVIGGFGADCATYGGCCMSNGDCSATSEDDCTAAGGSYLGDDSDCSTCVYGACCAGDGSCSESLDTDCDGDFVGGSCADASCTAVIGACCLSDLTCLPDMTPEDCDLFGGEHAGNGTDCSNPETCGSGNDNCDSAAEATVGSQSFDTTDATDSGFGEPDDTQCTGTFLDWTGSPDVWFYIMPGDGTMDISLCDSTSYDTSLVLYEGSSCSSLVQVACNGDSTVESGCQAYYSGIYGHPVSGGNTYYIRIGGWQAASGAGTMTITILGGNETGACCVAGDCVGENTASDCAALGGGWYVNQACADVSCPQDIACTTGNGEDTTGIDGAWTAGTSDAGSGYVRAAAVSASGVNNCQVYGLALVYAGGWGACGTPDTMGMGYNLYSDAGGMPGGEVASGSGSSYSATNLVYAGTYALHGWSVAPGYSGSVAHVSVSSQSAGEGECWFLWMSADNGASAINDGTGWLAETFAVNYCID